MTADHRTTENPTPATETSAKPLSLGQAIGEELRQEREARGLTRPQLVAALPSGIGDRTLLTYEHGIRSITVERLNEICDELGVSSSALLERARNRANTDNLENVVLLVDVAMMGDSESSDRFFPIHLWAANTRDKNPDTTVIELEPNVVREFAVLIGVSHRDLAGYLSKYTANIENA